jgi:hypothetical protein
MNGASAGTNSRQVRYSQEAITAILAVLDNALRMGNLRKAGELLSRSRRVALTCPNEAIRNKMYELIEAKERQLHAVRVERVAQTERAASARQASKGRDRVRLNAAARAQCVGCKQDFKLSRMSKKSGQLRCPSCHARWARVTCSRCGKSFKRTPAAPRLRLCDLCRARSSQSVRTVSGGLPTLGKRR